MAKGSASHTTSAATRIPTALGGQNTGLEWQGVHSRHSSVSSNLGSELVRTLGFIKVRDDICWEKKLLL